MREMFTTALLRNTPVGGDTLRGTEDVDFITRTRNLFNSMDVDGTGNVSWSVPVPNIFSKLRTSLLHPALAGDDKNKVGEEPSIEEVAAALSSMEIRLGAPSQAQEEAPPQREQSKEAVASTVAQAASTGQENIDDLQDDTDTLGGVGALFCSPPAPLLQQPAVRRARPRRTVDMSNVRRSARLAGKPSIPAMQMAQRNLCRKLDIDIGNDELTSVEDTLRDFVAMFQGPLPEQVVAAMTTIFGLDDDGAALLDDTLLQHAGEAFSELALDNG